jgi:hypothetical protein
MSTPLRYVVLYHDGIDKPHYDLMFEDAPGGKLLTWRSAAWPIERHTPLEKLDDHRREYLDYEGPLSGDRGFVRRIEAGTYQARPQWDDPFLCDLVLLTPRRQHLWLLSPPEHPCAVEPAEPR